VTIELFNKVAKVCTSNLFHHTKHESKMEQSNADGALQQPTGSIPGLPFRTPLVEALSKAPEERAVQMLEASGSLL
jgi:hypothetical protein